jgi:hypothetical protein
MSQYTQDLPRLVVSILHAYEMFPIRLTYPGTGREELDLSFLRFSEELSHTTALQDKASSGLRSTCSTAHAAVQRSRENWRRETGFPHSATCPVRWACGRNVGIPLEFWFAAGRGERLFWG